MRILKTHYLPQHHHMVRKNLVIPVFLSIILLGGSSPFSYSTDHRISVTPEIEQAGIFYGHQVVEVKVSNPDFAATDEVKGEQEVLVNGKILRMIQATDGNWYGYFAQIQQAQIADSTNADGVDFGTFCGPDSSILDISVSDTEGIAVNSQDGIDGTDGPTIPIPNCNGDINADDSMNVLENVIPINTDSPIGPGQLGMDASGWPFIQLYAITEETGAHIQYNVGGISEIITLDYVEQIPSAEELTNDLIFQVQSMDISPKTETKLLNHLNKILGNLEDENPNNDKNICNLLNSFENKVHSMEGKQITNDQAQSLIDSVSSAKETLCS